MKKSVCFGLLWTLFLGTSCQNVPLTDSPSRHNLRFSHLATDWENGIPLGNGILGQMVWRHHAHLRFSLGSRPCAPWKISAHRNGISAGFTDNGFATSTTAVQENFDQPYDRNPAPTQIPAGALEFDLAALGPVRSIHLHIQSAVCEVRWKNGARLLTFVQANQPVGWFRFEQCRSPLNLFWCRLITGCPQKARKNLLTCNVNELL